MNNLPDPSLIKPKFDIKQRKDKSDIVSVVIQELGKIELKDDDKYSIELLKYVCNLVEHLITKKGSKIDKKKLVIESIDKMISLNDLEKEILGNSIQFLYDNKEINKISVAKKVKGAVFGWIKKKLL
jgi:hypothetical protein